MGLVWGLSKLICVRFFSRGNSQIAFKSHKYWLLVHERFLIKQNCLFNFNRQTEPSSPNLRSNMLIQCSSSSIKYSCSSCCMVQPSSNLLCWTSVLYSAITSNHQLHWSFPPSAHITDLFLLLKIIGLHEFFSPTYYLCLTFYPYWKYAICPLLWKSAETLINL